LSLSFVDLALQRPTWAEVDLDKIHSNVAKVARIVPQARILAVVKSDGYGHGAVMMAREFESAGAAFLGTATSAEAVELIRAGVRIPIVVLSGVTPSEVPLLMNYSFVPAVSNREVLQALDEFGAQHRRRIPIHLKIDTGMGRLGFLPEEAERVLAAEHPWIQIDALFTHFANADVPDDPFTREQIARFDAFLRRYGSGRLRHASNSAGVLNYPEAHYDLVRPGLLLYGLSPVEGETDLEPILSLKTKIILLKPVRKGAAIGYGRNFIAQRDSLIATVPLGYADGLRRRLSNRLQVEVCGKMCLVAGNISMDLCMIDVTDVADRVRLYDTATFIGSRCTAWDWARLLDTVPYEVLCLIGARVPRVYCRNNEVIDVYYP
jgi:alanine racemase